MKTVGKTTRLFRYDLNQIPYDYIEELTNRFRGFYLIECLKNYGQRFTISYRRQQASHCKGKEMQEGKVVVEGVFTNS